MSLELDKSLLQNPRMKSQLCLKITELFSAMILLRLISLFAISMRIERKPSKYLAGRTIYQPKKYCQSSCSSPDGGPRLDCLCKFINITPLSHAFCYVLVFTRFLLAVFLEKRNTTLKGSQRINSTFTSPLQKN